MNDLKGRCFVGSSSKVLNSILKTVRIWLELEMHVIVQCRINPILGE